MVARAGLVGIFMGGAACASGTYLEDLAKPALLWERASGLCGSWLAVDAEGRLWRDDGGCEDGQPELRSLGKGDPLKVANLRRAFEALPANAGPERTECGGRLFRFVNWTGAARIESRACARGSGHDDLTGLDEPHLSVARGFLALP